MIFGSEISCLGRGVCLTGRCFVRRPKYRPLHEDGAYFLVLPPGSGCEAAFAAISPQIEDPLWSAIALRHELCTKGNAGANNAS